MEDDGKPLLGSIQADYYSDQIDFLDPRQRRPFHVEPKNIVEDSAQERVSAQASVLNSRVHYYGRLTASSDRLLAPPDHVIPSPEKLYIYSPLGTAFKVRGGEGSAKNHSIVTMYHRVKVSSFLLPDYVHHINVSDSEFGTNGTVRVVCPHPDLVPDKYSTISQHYIMDDGTDTALFDHWWNKTKTIPFFLIVLLLPLLNFRSASFFARFTFLGTISVIYLIILVTVKAFQLGFHLEFHWFDSTDFFIPEFRTWFPQLTGVLTLAFFIHNCIITLMKNNRNQENNVRDLSLAYLLVGLTYLYVGVMVFASFPSPPLSKDCIEPNFLDNFPSSDIMVFVARAFLLFQMTTVYPLLGYLVRVQLMGHFFGSHYPSFFHVFILNCFIVFAGVLMAWLYPNIGSIIRYSGATCGLFLVFIFPSAIHLKALRCSGELRWPSACFHIFLILLGVANLLAQFFM
ncbi:Sodium-coupled neutral amino acid transporter 9 [Bagarius yarrelli]|uniref:Neutral amino acid transporter 9 n=1 Tax=Bagarius yarrelli TaxID=175774 RepID=A0A556V282_BAGYA|nr:Sodium-coupled neutral amino acid transporter 9 [Bagarius yarrelli]